MDMDVVYVVCTEEKGRRVYIKLGDNGRPYKSHEGTPFTHDNGCESKREAGQLFDIVIQQFHNEFPVVIMEEWRMWDDDMTGTVESDYTVLCRSEA